MVVAVTGITGNMGQATLEQIVKIKEIDKFKFLVLPDDKRIKKLLRKYKNCKNMHFPVNLKFFIFFNF